MIVYTKLGILLCQFLIGKVQPFKSRQVNTLVKAKKVSIPYR